MAPLEMTLSTQPHTKQPQVKTSQRRICSPCYLLVGSETGRTEAAGRNSAQPGPLRDETEGKTMRGRHRERGPVRPRCSGDLRAPTAPRGFDPSASAQRQSRNVCWSPWFSPRGGIRVHIQSRMQVLLVLQPRGDAALQSRAKGGAGGTRNEQTARGAIASPGTALSQATYVRRSGRPQPFLPCCHKPRGTQLPEQKCLPQQDKAPPPWNQCHWE